MEPIRKNVYSKDEMKDMNVLYLTDIEGNDTYFEHVIKTSKGLFRDKSGDLDLKSRYHLVYGGDICDRGKGDLRIATDVVRLAKKYPDRVHLILGNRDINKIRLCTELQTKHLKQKLNVFWIDPDHINEPVIESDMPPCTRATRLHTILECTMGAPAAFEYRMNELLEMRIINADMSIAEKEDLVVDSFLTSMEPGGCILEFLRLGTLGLLLGDVFFFHGGVHEDALGWVPPCNGDDTEGTRVETVQDWCEALALFHHSEMTAVLRNSEACYKSRNCINNSERSDDTPPFSSVGGYNHPEPGSRLMQYGMGELPGGSVNPTLIYDNFLVEGAPNPPSDSVISFLNRSGVVRTVTGHQPHGDVPVVISTPSLQVLTGDTSYACNVEWDLTFSAESSALWELLLVQRGEVAGEEKEADTRGHALSELVISFKRNTTGEVESQVLIHGVTHSLFSYEFIVNEYVGMCALDDWWVKALFHVTESEEEDSKIDGCCERKKRVYMMSKSEGRNVFNTLVTDETLRTLLT